jgi:hypothetical protein
MSFFASGFKTTLGTSFAFNQGLDRVKNPVLQHGASSIEKAILDWGLCGFKPPRPFIPVLPSGAFWLFHVKTL